MLLLWLWSVEVGETIEDHSFEVDSSWKWNSGESWDIYQSFHCQPLFILLLRGSRLRTFKHYLLISLLFFLPDMKYIFYYIHRKKFHWNTFCNFQNKKAWALFPVCVCVDQCVAHTFSIFLNSKYVVFLNWLLTKARHSYLVHNWWNLLCANLFAQQMQNIIQAMKNLYKLLIQKSKLHFYGAFFKYYLIYTVSSQLALLRK